MCKFISLFLMVFLFVRPASAKTEAQGGWLADIHVYQNKAHNKLTIGQNIKASDGPDKNWEMPIPKTFLSGGVSSFFYHPEWKLKSPYFWRDIRPLGKIPCTWEFTVKTKIPNVEVELSWDVGRVKKGIGLYLKRTEEKEYFSLQKKKIYTYQSALRETRFSLRAVQIPSPRAEH